MGAQFIPGPQRNPNDEPVYEDTLGHHTFARQLGDRILECAPPYVVGVQGTWGSGKTSFLRKLWAYVGGDTGKPKDDLKRWFGGDWDKPPNLHPVWFNPWQHQFESSPMVALLEEVRRSFSLTRKFVEEAKKLTNVTVYSALSMLGELTAVLPKVEVKEIVERGREYEAEHFAAPLASQRFRDLFEAAIRQVIGKKGRMVVFIDDLDRCEGGVAYRLLESLKLYLNAQNCVYVLALDQKHLEETIARVLSGEKDYWRYRPLAREYLGKMFQCQFLLPVTPDMRKFIRSTLNFDGDVGFTGTLKERFGVVPAKQEEVVHALDRHLPHNPRKVKAFIAAWKLNLLLLAGQKPAEAFDWRVTVVLNYLGQFEEPLYRKVEESPGFFRDEILRFCRDGRHSPQYQPLFEGLELPYESARPEPPAPAATSSAVESFAVSVPRPEPPAETPEAPSPASRAFWIRDLVVSLEKEPTLLLGRDSINRHLLRAEAATS